jgi:hypothetical protein
MTTCYPCRAGNHYVCNGIPYIAPCGCDTCRQIIRDVENELEKEDL